jgi:hypothetical protein
MTIAGDNLYWTMGPRRAPVLWATWRYGVLTVNSKPIAPIQNNPNEADPAAKEYFHVIVWSGAISIVAVGPVYWTNTDESSNVMKVAKP